MTNTRGSMLLGAGAAAAALTLSTATGRAATAELRDKGDIGLDYRTTKELVGLLQSRQVSAVALLERSISRIEAHDGALNAVVVRDFERARAAATEADRALARGERRPLLGVPMTVKECNDVAGLPTTWASPAPSTRAPARTQSRSRG
jgi:amidase